MTSLACIITITYLYVYGHMIQLLHLDMQLNELGTSFVSFNELGTSFQWKCFLTTTYNNSWVMAHIPSKSPPALTSNVCLKKLTDETCKQDKCTCDCYSCSLKSDYHGAVCKSSRQLGEPRYLNKSLMPWQCARWS